MRDDYASATTPCVLHAIFVEGGLALAATAAASLRFIDPLALFYISPWLLYMWCLCGVCTGFNRVILQRKYHLEVITTSILTSSYMLSILTE